MAHHQLHSLQSSDVSVVVVGVVVAAIEINISKNIAFSKFIENVDMSLRLSISTRSYSVSPEILIHQSY